MALGIVEKADEQRLFRLVGDVAQGSELRDGHILGCQVLRVLQHQVDEYALDRRQQHVAAVGQAIAHQLLGALVAGERLRRVAMDHARQLIEQQYQREPALGQFGPVLQLAVQSLFDQCAEALARLVVLFCAVAKPESLLFSRDLAGAGALAEPPVEQVLPGRLHRSALVVAGDALDFFL